MPFKFDSQHFFLTYPQSDIRHEDLAAAIQAIQQFDWLRICTEQHEDGNPHVHAVGKFKRRFQSRNERVFDVNGRHPKIEPVRSINRALEYVSKDGNYTDFGNVPAKRSKRAWSEIVEAARGDRRDFLAVCYEERVPQYIAKELRELEASGEVDLDEYDGRPIAGALESLPKEYESMLIVGSPGIGKTGWAMKYAPRPALYVKHVDCLRLFRPEYHKSIVCDDIRFAHMPRETQMAIADFYDKVQIHVRYGMAIIRARVPRLFLCNHGAEPFIEDIAIQGRRVQVYRIYPSI